MKNVFLDTNVIIDLLDRDSRFHLVAKEAVDICLKNFRKPLLSPVTFAITFYFLEKFYKDKRALKKLVTEIFADYKFTVCDETIMKSVFNSQFTDLEDALQYFSALKSNADVILTFNVHDFIQPKIPVIHPLEFISYYHEYIG